jgi:hypothetical protein
VTQQSSGHAQQLSLSNGKVFAIFNDCAVQLTGQRFDFLFHVGAFDGLPNDVVVVFLKRI